MLSQVHHVLELPTLEVENCPVAWAGQINGKKYKPTIVWRKLLRDSSRYEFYMLVALQAQATSTLSTTLLLCDILASRMLSSFKYLVNVNNNLLSYYLVNGIYPTLAIFISTVSFAVSKKDKNLPTC